MMPKNYNPFKHPTSNNRRKTKGRTQNVQQHNGFTGTIHQQKKVEAFKRFKSLFNTEQTIKNRLKEKGRSWQSRKKLQSLLDNRIRPLIKVYEKALKI